MCVMFSLSLFNKYYHNKSFSITHLSCHALPNTPTPLYVYSITLAAMKI